MLRAIFVYYLLILTGFFIGLRFEDTFVHLGGIPFVLGVLLGLFFIGIIYYYFLRGLKRDASI